jgi:hypothetical protein
MTLKNLNSLIRNTKISKITITEKNHTKESKNKMKIGKFSSMMRLTTKNLREEIATNRKNRVISRQAKMSHTRKKQKRPKFKQKSITKTSTLYR